MRSLMFLSDRETTQVPVHADWTVRDVISHIAARECTVLAAVRHLAEDGEPRFMTPQDDRVFNLGAVSRRRDLGLPEVLDELEGTRQLLLRYIRRLPNRDLYAEFPVGNSHGSQTTAHALQEMIAHDFEHAEGIWQWRAAQGLLHRQDFRSYFAGERLQFLNALGGMHEDDMVEVPVCGHWTVRDVMCHVLSWDQEALHTAQKWSEARPWQDEALYDDEWNETEVARRADLNVIDLADGLATYHRKLLQHFDELSDAELAATSIAPWGERMSLLGFYYEMAIHDAAHRPHLLALQDQLDAG
jgi:hypothetical protein